MVRDIAYLYAVLEQAKDEGRRLEANASDQEGMLRYVNFLCTAFSLSIGLIHRMTGEFPRVIDSSGEEATRFNAKALELDTKFLLDITAKMNKAAFDPSYSRATKK